MTQESGKTRRKRIISFFLLITFVSEIVTPTATFALTGGPSQPEVQAFTPINTSEMVDLTSGDFKYNIPLMDVGGYPLNIAYNSGIGMDQEASWVGLGWNLNVGAINRNMRGLPDDFNGETIEKEFNMKDNNTYGVNVGVGVELFGWDKKNNSGVTTSKGSMNLKVGLGLTYNNYTGIGMEHSASIGISAGNGGKSSMNSSLGVKASNSGGLTISPNVSYSYKVDEKSKNDETKVSTGAGIGLSMNSRSGLKDLSVYGDYSKTTTTNLNNGKLTKESEQSFLSPSSGGVINFGASTFIPRIQNSMINNSVALSFKFGTTIFGLDGDITMGGYFSNQSLLTKSSSLPAYGYMFSHNGQNSDNVLMDFNREKDQSFSRYTKNLPITNQTYDVYSVTGQGIGGAFRPFRSDVGYMFDNSTTTTSDSYSASGELGVAQTAHLGVNISVVDVNTTTGKWKNDNDAITKLSAQSTTPYKDYEPYYFKEVGEKSTDDVQSALYDNLGGDVAHRIKLDGLINHRTTNKLERFQNSGTKTLSGVNYIIERQKRNQVMSTLSLDEAKLYGLDKSIYTGSSPMAINSAAKGHHIAEITALRLDGSRYVYGLPAYNTNQEEVTFNASYKTTSSNAPAQNGYYDQNSGYVTYNTGDRSTSNNKGIDNYYNKVKLPAYAHSYLLTAVISPDYVDLTGNGPSDDDFGNYTKFEYTRVSDMKWRMPYDQLKANFNEAGKSMENDDQGNFIYGEKELWFTTKIETKNYVATFELADRLDALGVNDIDGGNGPNTKKTKYIKSIALYSKPDYLANNPATSSTPAVPIKVVHFVYDYSLCEGIPNKVAGPDGSGKLTLKEVYFTYGKSDKAAFSKYKFSYGQVLPSNAGITSNFKYHAKAFDRWGNYMPLNNDPANYPSNTGTTKYNYNSDLNNAEFPYTDQFSKEHADFRASAWNLTKINLPSGAVINVNYESDDYAFVQNRPAMQMMKVVGIGDSKALASVPTTNSVGNLYNTATDTTNKKYLFFELTEPVTYSSALEATAKIRMNYLKDINKSGRFLYFRFLVNLANRGSNTASKGDHFEYVSGYAETDGILPDCGIVPTLTTTAGRQVGYLRLTDVVRDDKTSIGSALNVNPITKAALNFGKTHYNNVVWDASFSPPADVVGAVKQLASAATSGFGKQIIQAIAGPNNSLMIKGYGQEFVYGKSWIRLYNPSGHKFGGGSRVKELTINDNWYTSTKDNGYDGQDNSIYGQEYTYETEFNGTPVSSGVASYEPMLGGDENPFRQPVFMGPNKFTMLVPDERFFMEEPFGETFFPSASVAYSKVKVKNKIPAGANVKTHGTGYVVHEFYTAKDYPTLTEHTPIDPKQWKPPLGGLLKIMARDYVSASQGYVIKLNDMHGKQKAQAVYPEGTTTPISKVEYFYKTKGAGGYVNYGLKNLFSDASCIPNELDNSCIVIDRNGDIRTHTIGMDFDAVADFRESETTTIMGGAQINLSFFMAGAFPGLVPSIWPDFSYEKTRFRSSVMTKVISNYGILETTTAQDLGSKVTTANLAYDAQTGDVLVTRTKNDFEDNIYSVKYPAFWGYDLMGPAYKNIGFSETISFSSPGVASVGNGSFYNIGDEIALGGGNVGWICGINGNTISVIDKRGDQSMNGSNIKIKVLRSGRRNLLGAQMASLTSLVNPIDGDNDGHLDNTLDITTAHKVLNTSAIEYSDQWQTFKGYIADIPQGCTCALTPIGQGIVNLLTGIINGGKLFTQTVIYNSSTGIYSYGYTPVIQASVPVSPRNDMWGNIIINDEQAVFIYGHDGQVDNTLCGLQLVLPSGLDWNNVTVSNVTSSRIIKDPESCFGDKIEFCSDATISGTNPVKTSLCYTLSIYPGGNCMPGAWINCSNSEGGSVKCGVDEDDKVNPFVYGIKGNWRPKTTWSFLESRVQTVPSGNNNMDVRKDGYLTNYYPFYVVLPGDKLWTKSSVNQAYWTFTSEISKHTPNGVEVENRDALNRYSSALYGYNESLPIAVASNAMLQEIAFDGFEDYSFGSDTCNNFSKAHHFDFYNDKAKLNRFHAHTGKYSMKVDANTSISTSRKLMDKATDGVHSNLCEYKLRNSDFIYPFSPLTYSGDKKYILSYWVKEVTTNSPVELALDYTHTYVGLALSGGSGSIVLGTLKKSEIIDGWQRYEQDFTISSTAAGNINISLTNNDVHGNVSSYFDDIRIHPFNSNMKTFVYHPVTLKYVAELDANNFATFYEYDEEGSLIRVKKETERGIMTIQETKNHTKR